MNAFTYVYMSIKLLRFLFLLIGYLSSVMDLNNFFKKRTTYENVKRLPSIIKAYFQMNQPEWVFAVDWTWMDKWMNVFFARERLM